MTFLSFLCMSYLIILSFTFCIFVFLDIIYFVVHLIWVVEKQRTTSFLLVENELT